MYYLGRRWLRNKSVTKRYWYGRNTASRYNPMQPLKLRETLNRKYGWEIIRLPCHKRYRAVAGIRAASSVGQYLTYRSDSWAFKRSNWMQTLGLSTFPNDVRKEARSSKIIHLYKLSRSRSILEEPVLKVCSHVSEIGEDRKLAVDARYNWRRPKLRKITKIGGIRSIVERGDRNLVPQILCTAR